MPSRVAFLAGLGAGAAAMFLSDPQSGGRRRALLRNKTVRAMRRTGEALDTTGRDLGNRLGGAKARVARLASRSDTSDRVLTERVRAKLGRFTSHPRAIDVTARNGVVCLRGPILAHERNALVDAIVAVTGVNVVEDCLSSHDTAEGIPSLQGGTPRPGAPFELWQRRWSPTTRLLVGSAGGAMMAYGVNRRDVAGTGLSALGLGLLARSMTNLETRRLFGIDAGRRAVELQKTLMIGAPVDQVFGFWRRYEDFPYFLAHVTDVRPTRVPGQSHWTISGPAGASIQFDSVLTDLIPNRLIAWKTTEGATVAHAGLIRFEPVGDGMTRLTIRMSYNPPGGAFGHAAAAIVGQDLGHILEEELVRIKTFLETGRAARDAARAPAADTGNERSRTPMAPA